MGFWVKGGVGVRSVVMVRDGVMVRGRVRSGVRPPGQPFTMPPVKTDIWYFSFCFFCFNLADEPLLLLEYFLELLI